MFWILISAFFVIINSIRASFNAGDALVSRINSSASTISAGCDIFEPFRIIPENNKYQIGGAFSLHDLDCKRVNEESVQEVVAIQWALSHWNQKAQNIQSSSNNENLSTKPTLGFFAGDSCSRPEESVSQTLRFLDASGFYEPRECNHIKRRKNRLVGIISAKDRKSAQALAGMLYTAPQLPIGVFNQEAAEELYISGVQNVISTAPILDNYINAFLHLVRQLDSNLVAIVDGGENDTLAAKRTARITEILRQHNIFVSEVIGCDHTLLASTLIASDSKIIVSLVPPAKLLQTANIYDEKLLKSKKIWVNLEFYDDYNEKIDFLSNIANQLSIPVVDIELQLIVVRRKLRHLSSFNTYFRRVVINNFASFSLLKTFVEQQFDCTTLTIDNMQKNSSRDCATFLLNEENESTISTIFNMESQNIESALRLVFAFALISEQLENIPSLQQICNDSLISTQCYNAILKNAEILNYTFDGSDPADLRNDVLQFKNVNVKSGNRYFLMDTSIAIEGLLVERQGREVNSIYALFEWRLAGNNEFFTFPPNLRTIRSTCPSYRAYCGSCEHIRRFDNDEVFLSNPRQYPLYLAGIFDFHTGPNCEILRDGENIALPLAFSYALMQTASNNKSALEFGGLLVDGCSSDRRVMEFLVESENGCYRFTQADRNWTIVSGATFGYISTSSLSITDGGIILPSVTERFFTSQNSPASVLTLTRVSSPMNTKSNDNIRRNQLLESNQMGDTIFSSMPSHRSMATVLLKFLRRMRWEFINVVLDVTDADSMAIYDNFKQIVNKQSSICMTKTLPLNAQITAGSFGDMQSMLAMANVTVIFASGRSAADYLSARLRYANNAGGDNTHVHVLIGDAHDFYLYDPANVAHYAGAVSVQAKDMIKPEFRDWLTSITPLSLPEKWFWRYVEERWRCALSLRNVELYQGRMCTGDELLNVARMGRMTKAGYLAKSTEYFINAAKRIHRKLCGSELTDIRRSVVCEAFLVKGRHQIRNELTQLQLDDEFEVLEFQPIDHHGNFGYSLMANYSSKFGFHFFTKYKPYSNSIPLDDVKVISRCFEKDCPCITAKQFHSNDDIYDINENVVVAPIQQNNARRLLNNGEFLFANSESVEPLNIEEWDSANAMRYAFFALTTAFCAATFAIFMLVIVKMYFRIVKGNQSLGITLLAGIFILYATAFVFNINPTETVCTIRIAAHSIAHTICFGVLLAKALQLYNAETLAVTAGFQHAVTLGYLNYWLLLFFIFSVQLILWLRWFTVMGTDSISIITLIDEDFSVNKIAAYRCSHSTPEFFLGEIYTLILLFGTLVLSALNRNIKRNYKEAKWLFFASLSCTIIFTSWIASQAFLSYTYMNYATIVELYMTGTALLAFVFGPKIYVLLVYEPIIVECKSTSKYKGGEKYRNKINTLPEHYQEEKRSHNYDLFEDDSSSPLESRTISPVMSQCTTTPTTLSSIINSVGASNRTNASNKMIEKKKSKTISELSPRTFSTNTLSPTSSSSSTNASISDSSNSDSEALSSILHTVLRKKSHMPISMRRTSSQNTRPFDTLSIEGFATPQYHFVEQSQNHYGHLQMPQHPQYTSFDAGTISPPMTPFIVLPRITPSLDALSSNKEMHVKTEKKKTRSRSQKSSRI